MNKAVLVALAIVLAIGLCGCVTITTPNGTDSDGLPPQSEDQSEKHLSFQIDEPCEESPAVDYLYTFPIYLGEGQKLHLYWLADAPIHSGYTLPNGAYFRWHAWGYDRDELMFSTITTTNANINIEIGQAYEPIYKDDAPYLPGGVYEAGYYTFRFLSWDDEPVSVDVRYLIE